MAAVVQYALSGGLCGGADRAGAGVVQGHPVHESGPAQQSGAFGPEGERLVRRRRVDDLGGVRGELHAHTSTGTPGPAPQRLQSTVSGSGSGSPWSRADGFAGEGTRTCAGPGQTSMGHGLWVAKAHSVGSSGDPAPQPPPVAGRRAVVRGRS
jgi:hypothetical protein